MQQIKDYVEVMFKELPTNEHSARLKREMLNSMEEKYEEYRESGYSEAEAIGRVIGEFGSMDDLKEVFGAMHETPQYRNDQDIKDYLDYIPTFARNIALGVSIIIIGAGFANVFEFLKIEALTVISIFTVVIIGVALFITSGLKLSSYKMAELKKEMLSPTMNAEIQDRITRMRPQFTFKLVGGISLILVGVVVSYLIDSKIFNIETFQAPIFLSFVAVGVFMIIHGSIQYGSLHTFNELPSGDDQSFADRKEKKEDMIMSIFMIGATIIYLYYGFKDAANFGIYWYVFPLAALLGYLFQLVWNLFKKES